MLYGKFGIIPCYIFLYLIGITSLLYLSLIHISFKRGDVYLATKKIGKNNPKADKITLNNKVIQDWNLSLIHI